MRREELLSIIRNKSTERERKRNLHIAKLLIAGFVIIFVTCCSIVITDKIRTVKVDESTNEDSSFQNEMFALGLHLGLQIVEKSHRYRGVNATKRLKKG